MTYKLSAALVGSLMVVASSSVFYVLWFVLDNTFCKVLTLGTGVVVAVGLGFRRVACDSSSVF